MIDAKNTSRTPLTHIIKMYVNLIVAFRVGDVRIWACVLKRLTGVRENGR